LLRQKSIAVRCKTYFCHGKEVAIYRALAEMICFSCRGKIKPKELFLRSADREGKVCGIRYVFCQKCQSFEENPSFRNHLYLNCICCSDSYFEKMINPKVVVGFVYLIRCGKFHKIGKTINMENRFKQISRKLPYKIILIHSKETNNMSKLEAYWHDYFRERKINGEWFHLSKIDIVAFVCQ
jgi:hypothetical protein